MKRTSRYFFSLWATVLLAGTGWSEGTGTRGILERYRSIRPEAKDLAMYRLDWATSLDDALKRAAKESRPVYLIIIHAKYGDITSGHC